MNSLYKILLASVMVVLMAGCGPLAGSSANGNGNSSGVEATAPGVTGGDEILPTELGAEGKTVTVTLDDNGKTINLKQGERLLLQLGEGYNWELTVSDQAVLIPVMGVMLIRGAQGLYDTTFRGKSEISGQGDPTCLSEQPACSLPSIDFKVTVVVY